MVSKFSPTRLGRRKDSFVKSHVPSPTCRVSDEYEADPGGERVSAGAMTGDYLGEGMRSPRREGIRALSSAYRGGGMPVSSEWGTVLESLRCNGMPVDAGVSLLYGVELWMCVHIS